MAIATRKRQKNRDGLNPMPHRIFEIDEILRAIVWHTRVISETTTVSLACCCKAFEEPALSPLWVQKSFHELPALLTHSTEPTARPTEEEWERFQRYSSWIWFLSVDLTAGYSTEVLTLLNLIVPSFAGGQQATTRVFPNLRNLTWDGEPSSLLHLPSFVSSVLTDLRVRVTILWETEHFPGEYAPLESAINSTIYPPNLQSLCLYIPPEANPSPELKRDVANLILQCGSALTTLEVEFELPEPVVMHLMSLPNLKIWRLAQPAPMKLLSSPLRPTIPFAQVVYLAVRTANPHTWLSFLSALVGEKSHPSPVPRASAFAFKNLTHLDIDPPSGQGCPYSCTFLLTDSDISLLADVLPRLEWVWLGVPCFFNTCQTTFRSLYTLSTRCPRLQHICIHINTTTLVQDIRSFFEEERTETQGARPGPNIGRRSCPLDFRYVQYLPLEENVGVGDLEVVVKGFFDISVTINNVTVSDSNSKLWAKVSKGIKALHV